MIALFIGRFQPFHKGHLKVIKDILKKYDKLIIGIGSSQYKNTKNNPFSSDERADMIKKTLLNEGIKDFKIIKIPDIHDPPNWVDHVLSIYSEFDILVTNNPFTKKLFQEKDITVESTPIYNKSEFSGKIIRSNICKDKDWQKLVPKEVYKIIIENKGIERIKKFLG